MVNPIRKFEQYWNEAKQSGLHHPGAVCVSTIDDQGFPSGRFVDLKDIVEDCFVFCTNLDSPKGQELERNNKVALTFWWDALGYQIRITGHASQISTDLANMYWQTRSRDAKLTTLSCHQSKPLLSESHLLEQFATTRETIGSDPIPRPNNWGGYSVSPTIIEFLQFKTNRLHLRVRYTWQDDDWLEELLQP